MSAPGTVPASVTKDKRAPSPCRVCGEAEMRVRVTVHAHAQPARVLGAITASLCGAIGLLRLLGALSGARGESLSTVIACMIGVMLGIMANASRQAYACARCGALTDCTETPPSKD